MNYQNTTETYMRSAAKIGIRQNTRSQELDLSSWLVLWRPVGKILLLILPVVLGIHMLVASAVTDAHHSIARIDNQKHELVDKSIGLLAQRARLWSPNNMEKLAGQKLSLYSPKDQVGRFNSRTGSFVYR